MLLPYVCGRCYATRADVVAQLGSICSMAVLLPLIVADVVATCFDYIEYG